MNPNLQKPYEIKARLFLFSCDVIKAFPRNTRLEAPDLQVWRQLISAATSSGAHLEEAHAGGSRAHFISLSRGGLREMREANYWLRVLVATKLAGHDKVTALVEESNELVAILTAIVKNSLLKKTATAVTALLFLLFLVSQFLNS